MRIRQIALLEKQLSPGYEESIVFGSCKLTMCEEGYNRQYDISFTNREVLAIPGCPSAIILESYGCVEGLEYPSIGREWFVTSVDDWILSMLRHRDNHNPPRIAGVSAAYISDDVTGYTVEIPASKIEPVLKTEIREFYKL